MDQKKYLERIGYQGPVKPTLNVLQTLQRKHLLSVPFENLDIHYDIPIKLNTDSLFDKIVLKKRGGFCYELNGLFYALLLSLGYEAKTISARVYDPHKGYSPEYDHLAIVVKFEGTEYLTDVGFGEFAMAPIPLKFGEIRNDERGGFIVDQFDKDYLRVSMLEDGEKTPEYIFRNIHTPLHEFEPMCFYHQTSPDSHFTRGKLITIPTPGGRITLTGDKLKVKSGEGIKEAVITNEVQFESALWDFFRIAIIKKSAAS